MILRPFEYVETTTVAEAIDAVNRFGYDGQIVAGGTVVVPMMKHKLLQPAALIGIDQIHELRGVTVVDDVIRVGALCTHWDLARDATLRQHAPLLAAACGRVASPVIRSMGTLGGNVCYGESASDPPPALLALGASAVLRSLDGERTVALSEFLRGFYDTDLRDGELLTELIVPKQPHDADWTYFKWTPRAQEDKPLLGLAILLRRDGEVCTWARLAVSGIGETSRRLEASAAYLEGAQLTRSTINAAAELAAGEVDPIEDLQGSVNYRRDMLRVWVARVLTRLIGSVS